MANPNLPINGKYNTYVGARYVPVFADPIEWSATAKYEPLTIVTYQGNSYTSKTFVPVGVVPTNTVYWAPTGNYNAQVEQYRHEVLEYIEKTNTNINDIKNLSAFVTPEMFGAIGDGVTDDSSALNNAGEAGIVIGITGKKYLCESDVQFLFDTQNLNLILNDNIVARFPGNNTTHFNNTFEVPLAQVQAHTGRGSFCTRTSANNVEFNSCKWLRGTNGISITSSKNVKLVNCYFNRMYQTAYEEGGNGYGIFIAQGAENILISNCKMENIGRHFIYLSSDDVPITALKNIQICNCTFDNSNIDNQELPSQGEGTNIAINIRSGFGVNIINNIAITHDGFVGIIPNEIENIVGNILIEGNQITDDGSVNLLIRVSPIDAEVKNVHVINNIFNGVLPCGSINGIYEGNTFIIQVEGIRVYNNYANTKCIIKNNRFLSQAAVGSGTTNNSIHTLIIDGNYFECSGNLGFNWRGGSCVNVDFVNNIINSAVVATNNPIVCTNVRYAINKSLIGLLTPCFTATNIDHQFENAFNFA